MKQTTRKSKLWLLTLLTMLLGGVNSAWADELTVYDGTTTSSNIPFYGTYVDERLYLTEYIISASELSTIGSGSTITKLKLYTNVANATYGAATFQVFLEETELENLSGYSKTSTEALYDGPLSTNSSSEMEIQFTNDYTYKGGNLLVSIYQTKKGTYKATSFYGKSADSQVTYSGYSSNNSANYFAPKTTLTYEVAVDGPSLTVFDGTSKIAAGYSYNFGLSTAGTEKNFSLKNPGTEAVTVNIAATNGFGVSPTSATIEAKGEQTLTVTMADATATGEVTIIPTVSGVESVTIKVSGTVKDPNKIFIDFSDSPLPATWTLDNGWSVSDGKATINYASYSGGYVGSYIRSGVLSVDEGGENLLFRYARNYNSSYGASDLKVYWATTGNGSDADWTEATGTIPEFEYNVWKDASYAIPATAKYIAIYGVYVWIDDIYGLNNPSGALFAINTDGTTTQDLGAVAANARAEKTFTITNSGNVDLTVAFTASEGFSVNSSASLTVGAGESSDFTVAMNTTTAGAKSGEIKLAFEALNATEFTIPVSGYVFDDSKMIVDFNDNKLPEGWTNATNSGAAWTFADGVAYGQYASYKNAKMTSPLLTVAEGESLVFQTKANASYPTMKVYVYDRAGNSVKTLDFSTEARATYETKAFTLVTLSGLEAGDYRLEFEAYNTYIDNINGFTVNQNDPKLGIYTDADCTVAAATTVTKAYGFVTTAPEATTYYIKNDGTGTLTLSKTDADGFTATLDKTCLGAGEKATLTVSLPVADNGGYHKGNVVVTAADELGTFTVALSAVVVEDGKLNLNFATDDIPAAWTAGSWSKSSSGYVEAGYSSTTMQTSTLVAKANETLAVEAKQTYSGSSYTFGVKYRKVGADEWADLIPAQNIGTEWTVLGATIAEAGNYELQFTGNYTQIRRIYGLEKPQAPEMVVYDGEAVAAATYSFGKVTDEANAEHTFTVKNEGLATLNGLKAELSGDNADHYTVSVSAESIEAGESATVTVKQLKDNLGAHSATLTISATDLDSKVIALIGTTVDHTALDIDFDASSEWPAEILQHGDSWTVYNYSGSGEARQGSYQQATDLVLAPLTISSTEGKLTFDVAYYNYSSYRELTVSYSTDGGATWTAYNWGTEESPVYDLKSDIGYSYATQTITGIPAGTVVFKFTGKSIKIDNICGDMKVTTAPMVDFATTEDNINGQNLTADATATYTLQNFGNADYVATVTADGVTVEATGDGVIFEAGTLTVPAGKTATITATMAFAVPYGEKAGSLKLKSESWVGDITADFAAEAVDPTDFLVDFADNQKPAGWYLDSWTVANGVARINAGNAKAMITEKIGAEDGKNVLSFDAKVYSDYGGTYTLSVYTSADRQTWSEAQTFTLTNDVQNFQLEALAKGEFYVKFEALNATVDNIKGVKKVALPEHDLYVSATTLPAGDYFIDTEITATATVASLISNETGVYAKLLIDNTEAATADAASIAVNGTATFSMSYTAPSEAGIHMAVVVVYNSSNKAVFTSSTSEFNVVDYPALVLSETEDPGTFTAGTYNVTLNRTFKEGWNTVCLPFDVKVTDIHADAVAYSFDAYNSDTKELTFNKVAETLSARTPYVIYVPAEFTQLVFKKQAISNYTTAGSVTHSPITFQGSYATVDFSGMDGTFYGITTAGKIAKASASATMKGFRGYFTGIPANARMKFIGDDVATGIRTMTFDTMTSEGIFNLQGQKVEQLNRGGLYIINGKKTIVK